mgnify:CR=1 FL=1
MSKIKSRAKLYLDHAKTFAQRNERAGRAGQFDCAHFMIYEVVLSFSERKHGYNGTLSTLGAWCHIKDMRTVKKKLCDLQDAGFISIKVRKGTSHSIRAEKKLPKSGKFVNLWKDNGETLTKKGITPTAALLAYSVISHFEQSARGWCGSTKYLMEWMPKISKSHINNILQDLRKANLITVKTDEERTEFYSSLDRSELTHQSLNEDDDIPF